MIVDVTVEAGEWPEEIRLRAIAEGAIAAAESELGSHPALLKRHGHRPGKTLDPSPLPNSSPQGAREGAHREAPEVSLVFTSDAKIRKLNKEFRAKDTATNVLSFPQESGPLLGDVILASETLHREAALAGKRIEAHMAHLIIHGFLHLLGHDHEEESQAEAMEAIERAALKRMGIADPYASA